MYDRTKYVLDLPFRPGMNPDTEKLELYLRQCFFTSSTITNGSLKHWEVAKFHRLVGRMFTNTPMPRLAAICEAVLWLFFVDDCFETEVGLTAIDDAYRTLARQIDDILVGQNKNNPPSEPLVKCIWDFRANLVPSVSSQWWKRFGRDLQQHLKSIYQQACSQSQGILPDLPTYLEQRYLTSGWDVLVDLTELDWGIDISNELLNSSLEKQLRKITAAIASATNDVLSLDREIAEGDAHNIVLIFQRTHHCDLEEALKQTHRWIGDRLDEYFFARDEFLSMCGQSRSVTSLNKLSDYVSGLENLMRGTLDWCLETGRYTFIYERSDMNK